uniref:Protein FAM210B like n=1 Tax=Tanacetum cinerariifolium TaxID=118510 RepID=A0A699HG12_TANCI|nr:protein FAM210B like [Tanacetum cinerariifolium]
MAGGRFSELMKKYGKVALGVHFTVSGATIAGLYIAIKNNVDVESVLEKVRFKQLESVLEKVGMDGPKQINEDLDSDAGAKERNRTAEMAASSGGALALAVLCNKALFPVRVPITIAVTPSIARFLARRQIIKNAP